MEAGRMVVVDGVAEFVEDDEIPQMFGQRHQVQAQRQVVAPVAGAPFGAGGPDRYRTVLQTGFALRVPLRGTVVQPPLRAATVPIGGVLLRAKGWGVEVVGRAARLFDPGPSESIRCGFPEIPRPGGRDAVRVGEPDGAVRPYAERNAPCPSALREGHLSDYRMDDRLLPADGFSGLGLRFGLSGCRMIRLGAKQAE